MDEPLSATGPGRRAQREALALGLRPLRALVAVADAGSTRAAAEGLFRVASAVTRSIAELEQALGRPLLERRARGMVPNAHGALVIRRVRRIEQAFAAARAQLVARAGISPAADTRSLFASIQNGRRLAVIASLADRRPMGAVAEEFGITQPAVSAALKALESGLGTALFERDARGLVPTAGGEIVALHFKRVLAELRHIVPDLLARDGLLAGSVHVGALPLGRTHLLPRAIATLLAAHPQLRVATYESPYEALAAQLRSGDIDFILGALRPDAQAKDLRQRTLFEDRLAVIARAGHPLATARADPNRFDRLGTAAWVLSRPGSPSRMLLEQAFAAAGRPPPEPAVETGDLAVLRGLLRAGDMLTAISPHQLREEIALGSLVVLDVPLENTRRHIGLTERAGAIPSPGAAALMEEIARTVAASAEFAPLPQASVPPGAAG